jgi:hydrogenase expression/formation protein HypC
MCLGMPARVLEAVDLSSQRLLVDVQGQRQQVSAAMLMDDLPRPGQWVLVHMGFALSRMDETEARSVLESLDELSDRFDESAALHGL